MGNFSMICLTLRNFSDLIKREKRENSIKSQETFFFESHAALDWSMQKFWSGELTFGWIENVSSRQCTLERKRASIGKEARRRMKQLVIPLQLGIWGSISRVESWKRLLSWGCENIINRDQESVTLVKTSLETLRNTFYNFKKNLLSEQNYSWEKKHFWKKGSLTNLPWILGRFREMYTLW